MSTATTPKLFNHEGRVLEYDKNLDYFTLFGIDKSFNIEIADVAKTYKNLQKQLHPDKVRLMCEYFELFKTLIFYFQFVNSPPEDSEKSETWSAAVNDGYKILQKPLSRALYLLEICDHPLTEEGIDIDPVFLSDIMDLNEEVAEADQNQIKLLEDSVKSSLEEYFKTLAILFENDAYIEARKQVAHMKYYSNLLDKIYEKQSEFGMY